MRLSIRNKFAAALVLLAVAVVAAGFCSVLAMRFNEEALTDLQQGRLRSLLLARDAQNAFQRYVKDVEVAAATDAPQLLGSGDAVIAELRRDVAELDALNVRTNPGFSARVGEFVRLAKDDLRLGRQEGGGGDARRRGALAAAELRVQLAAELQELERNASLSYERDVASIIAFNQRATKGYMLLVSAMTVAGVGLSGAILATVLRRIRRLGEHFANTDLDKITPLGDGAGRGDELDDLVLAANRMLLGIKESRRQLVDKALLDSVMDALVDLIVVVDSGGRIVRANRASERLLGTSPEALEGCGFADWLVLDERSRAGDIGALFASIAAGETVSEELSLQGASAALLPVHLIGAQLPGASVAQAVFVARDLRPKLAVEKRMQLVQAQLVQASKLASLGTLGAGVAHELNNPLAAVRGYAELLANAADTPAGGKTLATKILKSADRIRRITDHLRIFATDTSRQEKIRIDLNTVVQDALILLQNQLVTSGLSVDVVLAPGLPLVLADANQLESVVQNLLTNARDALEETTDGRDRRVAIRTGVDAAGLVFVAVEDNADGIPERVQPRVFDPFFTTKEVGKGTGLGLSIAHGVVRDHGGTLSFTTARGRGTVFTTAFPPSARVTAHGVAPAVATAGSPAAPTAAAPPAPRPASPEKRCLVILDDEVDIGEILAIQLSSRFNVECFSDPALALARCVERPVDLVITDMHMPVISGLDVVRQLRLALPGLRVLVISGSGEGDADVQAALADGAWGIIPKPFPTTTELLGLLASVLDAPNPDPTSRAG